MDLSTDSLDGLFNPRSIAVVGAARDPSKAGYNMMRALRGFPGALYPINPKVDEVDGLKAYPRIEAVGKQIDLIALCIPARLCLETIKAAGGVGVRAALIASGGFGEVDEEGLALQEEILALCRLHSIRLLGPNTAGFANPKAGVTVNFNPIVADLRPGHIGVISQSGAMSLVLGAMLHNEGMGLSICAGTGNALDIGIPELIRYLSLHEDTRSIAVYLEGVEDGRELYDAVYEASRKKPVVVFSVGKADVGEFAASHTGKMIGSFDLKRAALIQAGAVVVSSTGELIDAANILSRLRLSPGQNPGVGLLTGQAGPAMVISDFLLGRSVSMPHLSPNTIEQIAKFLPLQTYMKNPVDTARPTHASFLEVLSLMAADENIDVLLSFVLHEPMCIDPAPIFRTVKGRTGKPLIFGTSGITEDLAPTLNDLLTLGVPAFVSPDRAAAAAWALVEDSKGAYRKQRQSPDLELQTLPERLGESPDEAEAKALLNRMNIATPVFAVCETPEEAIESFRKMKKPCVAKILSRAITHKTEVGGVHLDLYTDEQLIEALRKVDAIDAPGEKKYLIEEMAPAGLEIIIGAKNDVSFGPSVMAGLGGTAAEALGDTSIRIAPLDVHEALDMLSELRASRLFDRWRGGPRYDRKSVAELLVKVGHLMVQHPEIREMDLNPVRVYEKGILVLDALMACNR